MGAKLKRQTAACAAAFLMIVVFTTGQAHAARVGLRVYYNPDGAKTKGLDLVLDVTQVSGMYVFEFSNATGDASSIINFYFEAGLRDHFLDQGIENREGIGSSGTDIVRGATPRQPPAADAIGWITNTFSYGAAGAGQNQVMNGLNAIAETFTVKVLSSETSTLSELLKALKEPRTRIAVGVIGAKGENIAAYTQKKGPPIIPTPVAAIAGFTLLGVLGLSRRRRA